MKARSTAIALLLLVGTIGDAAASRIQAGVTDPMAASARKQLIESLLKELNRSYVLPEVARKMEADIRTRLEKKEYDSIPGEAEFASKLTQDLQAISRDLHLMIHYSQTPIQGKLKSKELSDNEKESRRQLSIRMNQGFERVERMQGNIGYIDLRRFVDPELSAETLAAAMTFVSNTEALIIDLRNNGGGPPESVALMCSYFFDSQPVHLNDLYWRESDRTEEFWTKPTVTGRPYVSKDVYVLIGRHTYSAAEEFAYDLKNLKRATIVGETSGGAAHHGEMRKLNEHFSVYLPLARAINPITKGNWEGTGVTPDVVVPEIHALQTAYVLALSKAMEKQKDLELRNVYKQLIEQQQKELQQKKGNGN